MSPKKKKAALKGVFQSLVCRKRWVHVRVGVGLNKGSVFQSLVCRKRWVNMAAWVIHAA